MPTNHQRRMMASPGESSARDAALLEFLDAHEKIFGTPDDVDIDDVPDPDEDEGDMNMKDLVSRLGDIETKVRRVETPEGEIRYHAPKGSVIGAGGKVVYPKAANRPRDTTVAPVSKNKVKKITVEHLSGPQVNVLQHTAQGTFMTMHPDMASADAHIDAILERHDHLGSIHHQMGDKDIEVRHEGDIFHGGVKIGKVKRGETVSAALVRTSGPFSDEMSRYSVDELRNGHKYGGREHGLPDKEVFAAELRKRGYRQHPLSDEWVKPVQRNKPSNSRGSHNGSVRHPGKA